MNEEMVQTETEQTEEVNAGDTQAETAQTAEAGPEAAQAENAQAETAQPENAQAEAASDETAQPGTTQAGATQTAEAGPEAAQAEAPAEETMADLEDHFDDASPWNRIDGYLKDKTVLDVTVERVVKGGVITTVEGIRGFIPASQLSLSYVENLEDYLQKEIKVQVIEASRSENRLILSARRVLRAEEKKKKAAMINEMKIGTVTTGTVETLQPYGAFIRLENGLSGLVHVSQISEKRIPTPASVISEGQSVTVKVIDIRNGKLSLSMKGLGSSASNAQDTPDAKGAPEKVVLPKSGKIGTSLGDLFKNMKL